MESKLLKAAKEMEKWLAQNDGDVDLDSVLMTEFRYAIREAEQQAEKDGLDRAVLHKAALTPKPDPWACRLHPEGRCDRALLRDYPGMANPQRQCFTAPDVYALTTLLTDGLETCPWSSRQKPAPARRTKFDVAVEAVHNLHINSVAHPQDWEYAKVIMKVLGVNPDEVEG